MSSSAKAEATAPSLTPVEKVRACVADVKNAEWIAIDLEFSGLFTDKPRPHERNMDEYFKHVVESVVKFSCIQIGLCCVIDGKYLTHEFYVAPRQNFSVDLQALRFLRRHKFDVNAFIEGAMPCDRVGQSRTGGITEVIEALIEKKCPLIFHHGLFDLLHIANAFLGSTEELTKLEDFLSFWREHVSNPVFDTRHLAQEGKLTVLHHAGGIGLQELHRSLVPKTKKERRKGEEHSGGQDALMTAELFVAEMDLYAKDAKSKSKKRDREDKPFMEGKLADRFRNFVAVGAVEPGFVKLA